MAASSGPRLRRQLVSELRAKGVIRSPAVEAAFLAVPRERFIPAVLAERGFEAVYRDEAFVTKRDARGMPRSSSSQPALMAEMLELLEVRAGQRVLEIGSGTGYNAALLAQLAGPSGRVSTVDVDPELARAARRALRETGHRATVIAGDGRDGVPRRAPFDRIIVTACADEIPRAWFDQLAERGRLVVPLRLDPDGATIQLIPVLERRGARLRSVGLTWGGFMPLHGGDGGWRPPPAALGASRRAQAEHSSLTSLTGGGLNGLSDPAARRLLASVLTGAGPPLRRGLTELDSKRPPLLLIYLLLRIPARDRVSVHRDGRLGIGILDRRGPGLAVLSVRDPWSRGSVGRGVRAGWRLDAYGQGGAAARLEGLLAEWRELQRSGRRELRISSHVGGARERVRLRFSWSRRR